jgi:hypothetical protein
MKYSSVLISALALFFFSCNCSKTTTQQKVNNEQIKETTLTAGKVSHEYRATGCRTVIIVSTSDEPLTLIPKDDLPEKFDKDGLEILFNFRLLKMLNPEGCSVGIPAELSDISVK